MLCTLTAARNPPNANENALTNVRKEFMIQKMESITYKNKDEVKIKTAKQTFQVQIPRILLCMLSSTTKYYCEGKSRYVAMSRLCIRNTLSLPLPSPELVKNNTHNH